MSFEKYLYVPIKFNGYAILDIITGETIYRHPDKDQKAFTLYKRKVGDNEETYVLYATENRIYIVSKTGEPSLWQSCELSDYNYNYIHSITTTSNGIALVVTTFDLVAVNLENGTILWKKVNNNSALRMQVFVNGESKIFYSITNKLYSLSPEIVSTQPTVLNANLQSMWSFYSMIGIGGGNYILLFIIIYFLFLLTRKRTGLHSNDVENQRLINSV